MMDYPKQQEMYVHLDYAQLTKSFKTIDDIDSHNFLNEIFCDSVKYKPSTDRINIDAISIEFPIEVKQFIKKLPNTVLSPKERSTLIQSCCRLKPRVWDTLKLEKLRVLTPAEINSVTRQDTTDFWEAFHSKYGYSGIHSFSQPLFNRKKDVVIINHSFQGDWLSGFGQIECYKKRDRRWELIKVMNLWIS